MDGLKPVQEVLTVCLVFISTFSDLIKRQTFFKNVRFARVMMVESKAPLSVGISSTAWDSIAEVTALAVNSSPTTALRNTCAGIAETSIFRTPVRILAFMDPEGEGEHLEMVFGGRNDNADGDRTIKTNRTYGTLPGILRRRIRHEPQREVDADK